MWFRFQLLEGHLPGNFLRLQSSFASIDPLSGDGGSVFDSSLVKLFGAWTQFQASSSSLSPSQPPSVDLPSSSSSASSAFDLKALQRMVEGIEAVLKDAEEREIHDESVRLWLKDLRDVAYEADDVLDDYEYELLRAKAEAGIQSGEATPRLPRKQTHQEVCDVMITSPSLNASFWSEMADRVQKIRGKLEEVSKLRDTLHLREEDGQRCSRNTTMRPPSSHLLNVTHPRGREDDLKKFIGMLLSDECTRSDLFVIPIVGIGGVGKTTLAQLVYNDSEVRKLFQLRGWVSVSVDFGLVQLTRKILETFTKAEQKLEELSVLQEQLIGEIQGKRFLLVLDDVWNENPDLCDSLLLPLKHGKHGSAIITTTRSQNVAAIMAPKHHHRRLDCLSKEHCWEVLRQNAFHGQDIHENYQELVEIGKQIAIKCKGLPLAAKSLGCLLSRDYDAESWRDVLESNVWDVDDKIIPALMLSYVHLPSHLKQCFLYASLFPKDTNFEKDVLVRLWMAQGFIRQRGNRALEDLGNMYFDELLKRSFFQNYPYRPSLFVMHDLIHDLAQYISRGEHIIVTEEENTGTLRAPEARHLSLQGRDDTSVCDLPCLAPEAVRTVLNFRLPVSGRFQRELEFITKNMLSLRVLNLRRVGLRWLPEAIGNLKHLRYLNLQYNEIEILPDLVGKLYHLQTLILSGNKLESLPTCITNLANLRCLEVGSRLIQIPRGIGKLTNLRLLDVFNVGEVGEGCAGVEELKDLKHLRGNFTINNLEYVVDAEKAEEADLKGKTKIRNLKLNWYCDGKDRIHPLDSSSHDQQKKVLENLRPYGGLKRLTIHKYCGVMLPQWLGDPCFSRLAEVEIDCPELIALPAFGQLPSLERLVIGHGVKVKVVGSEFRGRHAVGFPFLETLEFADMPCWVEWQGVRRGDFPRLRSLEVTECPQLTSIVPLYHLPKLKDLILRHCKELTSIEFRSPSSSSSSCSSSSTSSIRPTPPLVMMRIEGCPQARFSPEDDERLLLPTTLRCVNISSCCPLLVKWFQTDAGGRLLSGIPGVELQEDPEGGYAVSTPLWPKYYYVSTILSCYDSDNDGSGCLVM